MVLQSKTIGDGFEYRMYSPSSVLYFIERRTIGPYMQNAKWEIQKTFRSQWAASTCWAKMFWSQ